MKPVVGRHRPAPRSAQGAATGRRSAGTGEGGFTLLELIISLGLFALIAVAGLTLLDSVMKVQERTEGRLDRTASLQRAMFVIQSDLDQITRGEVSGGGAGIAFTRVAAGLGGLPMPLRYESAGGALVRAAPQPQLLLTGVAAVRWRFLDGRNWVDRWPPNEERKADWPRAIQVEIQVGGVRGPQGLLRRVVALPARPRDEQGMILVNVLMFVAIASGLVLLMIGREELALDRALRGREAARAAAIVRGGELSAIAALQRDAMEAPQVDHAGEAWASIGASGAAIDGGRFDLAVSDAEGRFNVNSLRSGDAVPVLLFEKLARVAGLDEQRTVEAIAYVRTQGPVSDIRPIRLLPGVDAAAIARLERMVTALPGKTQINLNAADQELLAFLFTDPVVAERLVAIRKRNGQITLRDLSDQKVSQPAGTSFRSDTFWVHVRATIGG